MWWLTRVVKHAVGEILKLLDKSRFESFEVRLLRQGSDTMAISKFEKVCSHVLTTVSCSTYSRMWAPTLLTLTRASLPYTSKDVS